jgi:hypothetical protein
MMGVSDSLGEVVPMPFRVLLAHAVSDGLMASPLGRSQGLSLA